MELINQKINIIKQIIDFINNYIDNNTEIIAYFNPKILYKQLTNNFPQFELSESQYIALLYYLEDSFQIKLRRTKRTKEWIKQNLNTDLVGDIYGIVNLNMSYNILCKEFSIDPVCKINFN